MQSDIYSVKTILKFEKYLADRYKLDTNTLVERAGDFISNFISSNFNISDDFIFICGKGYNGADALVGATNIKNMGYRANILMLSKYKECKKITQEKYNLAVKAGVNHIDININDIDFNGKIIVDGILGSGLTRSLDSNLVELIKIINKSNVTVISLDVPTGLNADTGCCQSIAIKADYTLGLLLQKRGLFTQDSFDYVGKYVFNNLGLDESYAKDFEKDAALIDATKINIYKLIDKLNVNKGSYGKVLVVGGNYGMVGAGILTSLAAYRSGAGLVQVVTRKEHQILSISHPSLLTARLKDLENLLNTNIKSVIIGPGLGKDQWAKDALNLVLAYKGPKVIDADALDLLPRDKKIENTILTPHPGEAARILNTSIAQVQENRFTSISNIVKIFKCGVILKGAGSLYCNDKYEINVLAEAVRALAKAGSGDVLSGIIAAILAQGKSIDDASKLAMVIHCKAGKLMEKDFGCSGGTSEDLVNYIAKVKKDAR